MGQGFSARRVGLGACILLGAVAATSPASGTDNACREDDSGLKKVAAALDQLKCPFQKGKAAGQAAPPTLKNWARDAPQLVKKYRDEWNKGFEKNAQKYITELENARLNYQSQVGKVQESMVSILDVRTQFCSGGELYNDYSKFMTKEILNLTAQRNKALKIGPPGKVHCVGGGVGDKDCADVFIPMAKDLPEADSAGKLIEMARSKVKRMVDHCTLSGNPKKGEKGSALFEKFAASFETARKDLAPFRSKLDPAFALTGKSMETLAAAEGCLLAIDEVIDARGLLDKCLASGTGGPSRTPAASRADEDR